MRDEELGVTAWWWLVVQGGGGRGAAERSPVNNSISASVYARVYATPCLEELITFYSEDMGGGGCLNVVCVCV